MGLARARQVLTCLSILLCTWTTYSHVLTHDGIRSVNEPKPEFFIDSIFDKYATNSSISLQEFKGLLKELQIGAISRENTGKIAPSAKENVAKNGDSKCYPAEDLFQSYSIGTSGLDKKQFEGICPAIVQQIDSGACIDASDHEEEEIRQSKTQAWGYGFLAVTIISCTSLLGAFVVPFMSQWFYKILLLFMVSLAVGVLSGSGIFHLIPHAFQLGKLPDGSYNYSYLWKCLTIIGGIYLFFVLEYVMKMIVRFKEKALQATEQNGLESNHVKSELPSAGIADVQLQLYNTAADHHHTHGNVFCLNPKLSDKDGVHVEVKDKSTSNCLIKSELKDEKSPKQKKRVAPVAWMIIIGDGLHNFIDGLAIGASFSTSNYVGISTSLAIFCEELPHELGDFAVLLNAGMNYKKAMGFNFLSACACYAGLVIGLLLGYTTSAVSWIYALAGGMFIYISLVDMLEEATDMSVKIGATSIRKNLQTFALQNFGMLLGFAVMLILAQYGTDIAIG